jgi:hypothetical protein
LSTPAFARAGASVIDATSDYPRADYDVIETRIAI